MGERCSGCGEKIAGDIYANGWCSGCREAAKRLSPSEVCESNRIYDQTDGRSVVGRWRHEVDDEVSAWGPVAQCRHCHRLFFASAIRPVV